ncbi:MAG: FGGY-family carbohydrate kinase, partial [Chitinophagales bacterium]
TTIAWRLNNKTTYALEGSVFIAGAVIQWLRDALQIIEHADETEAIASVLPDNGGVYFIPAFTGLGAPYWDMEAKGSITGLTRGTGKAHIVRAALESIAYQVRDVFDAMQQDADIKIQELRIDGGAAKNNWLIQFQCDILQTPVVRNAYLESTALGIAMLAGISAQLFTAGSLPAATAQSVFYPAISRSEANVMYNKWVKAVKQIITQHFN